MSQRRSSISVSILDIRDAGTAAALDIRTNWKTSVNNDILTVEHGFHKDLRRSGVGKDVATPNDLPTNASSFIYPDATDVNCNGLDIRSAYTVFDFHSINDHYRNQIAIGYRNNEMFFRSQNGDLGAQNYPWNIWNRVFHSNNPPNGVDVGLIVNATGNNTSGNVWAKLATVTITQNGEVASLKIMGGNGFNVGSFSQATETDVIIRPGNNNPKGITVAGYTNNTNPPIKSLAWKPVSGDIYEIYAQFQSFVRNVVILKMTTTNATIDVPTTFEALADKPTGCTDGQFSFMYHSNNRQIPKFFDSVPGAEYMGAWYTAAGGNWEGGINIGIVDSDYRQLKMDGNAKTTVSWFSGNTVKTKTLFTTDGGDINGSIKIRVLGGGIGQVDLREGNYTLGLRNDGLSFYMLTTNRGDPDGTWNALRPFRLDLSNGDVALGTGALVVKGNSEVVELNSAEIRMSPGWGNWLSMRDRKCIKSITDIAAESASPVIIQNHPSMQFILGGLGNREFGFYNILKSRTENGTDGCLVLRDDGKTYGSGNAEFSDVYIRSDVRLKDNFSFMNNPTERLMQLVTCFYDKYSSLDKSEKVGHEFGIIAQSLLKSLPEAVQRSVDVKGNDIIGISNSAINGLVVNYLQKLNNGLKTEFNNLRKELGLKEKDKFAWER